MRVAVLSDIHANLEALDAVLARADEERADAIFVLGDIVGYGADPVAVLERLAQRASTRLIAGNHDLAAVGRFDVTWFNPVAAAALRWTADSLTTDARAVLETLQPADASQAPLLVHGSVVDPAAEYVTSARVAEASFDATDFDLCFFGHTHLPVVFERDARGRVQGARLDDGDGLVVRGDEERRYMVNPGSVGQPRDGDPRASFILYDSDEQSVALLRVEYAIGRAQEKIRAAGLPDALADRLAVGR